MLAMLRLKYCHACMPEYQVIWCHAAPRRLVTSGEPTEGKRSECTIAIAFVTYNLAAQRAVFLSYIRSLYIHILFMPMQVVAIIHLIIQRGHGPRVSVFPSIRRRGFAL